MIRKYPVIKVLKIRKFLFEWDILILLMDIKIHLSVIKILMETTYICQIQIYLIFMS